MKTIICYRTKQVLIVTKHEKTFGAHNASFTYFFVTKQ